MRCFCCAFFALVVSCQAAGSGARDAGGGVSPVDAALAPTPPLDAAADSGGTALLSDRELGALIATLSEAPGAFPSDNYVTNETTYLDVAAALRAPALRGRAYVGVGPEQNLSYVAMLAPVIAYVVDIRRGNLLELMMLRGCVEAGATRAAYLSALTARAVPDGLAEGATVGALVGAFATATADDALERAGVLRTRALMDRLGVPRSAADDADLDRIHRTFAKNGLSLAYTMKGSGRRYPTLGESLAMTDPSGVPSSFLASEDAYAVVRRAMFENRVVPVVGDFGGAHALRAVGADMRARGVMLGAFYASNVEQYLFESHTEDRFVESLFEIPKDAASVLVRVWFDQGRAHPKQRPGHRTTSLVVGAEAWVTQARKAPYRSYWDVVKNEE